MPQCQGRKTTPKSSPLFFAGCPRLHKKKPLSFLGSMRCPNESEDLCATCEIRLKSTDYQVEKRAGKYIPNQETMFHGRIGEPIPSWSRLYKGPWFEEQVRAGYTVSEETRGTATAMLEGTYKETPIKSTGDMIVGSIVAIDLPKAKPKQKKTVVSAVEAVQTVQAVQAVQAVKKTIHIKKAVIKPVAAVVAPKVIPIAPPVLSVEPVAPVNPIVKKKLVKPKPKPAAIVKEDILGFVDPIKTLPEDLAVKKIPVRRMEIDGRSVYLDSVKDKVYDLKFVYLGRFNRSKNEIDGSFKDSDVE